MGTPQVCQAFLALVILANLFYRMILTGLSGIIVVEIYSAIMQWKFQNTTNTVGKGFAILGIYLFSVIYCEFSKLHLKILQLMISRWNDKQHNLDLRL
jgi:hypothetical protein